MNVAESVSVLDVAQSSSVFFFLLLFLNELIYFLPLCSCPAALLPLHLGHGQQRLGSVRPRQGRPLVRAGRLLSRDPQQAARHLPGRALLQAAAHRRWTRPLTRPAS